MQAAKEHSLPSLGLCMSRENLLQDLRDMNSDSGTPEETGREGLFLTENRKQSRIVLFKSQP